MKNASGKDDNCLCSDTERIELLTLSSDVSLKVLQAKDGYRYSIDPFLLADFSEFPRGAVVIDLGSGSGILPLLLSVNQNIERLVGLELLSDQAERARRSVALNGLSDKIEIVCGDIRNLPSRFKPESFDVVVMNPPYRKVCAGRISAGRERATARHEVAGGLADFISVAGFLLKSKGRFFCIFLVERLPELFEEMRRRRIEPKRIRFVHSRLKGDAKLVLVEGRKNGRPGLKILTPMVVYQGAEREYSDEVRSLLTSSVFD